MDKKAEQFSSTLCLIVNKNFAFICLRFIYQIKYFWRFANFDDSIRVVRQLVNSQGRVVASAQFYQILKAGDTLFKDVKQTILKSLPAGTYTAWVKIYDADNKIIAENNFSIELKKRYFIFGELPANNDFVWDAKIWSRVKNNVRLPVNLKLRFSYVNKTKAKQAVKLARELIDENDKIRAAKISKRTIMAGKKYDSAFTQWLGENLPVGKYRLRLRAYDWASKELLAENSVDFAVATK